MPEEIPTQIGRYQVQTELGRGGFGRVYRAFDPTVSRLVAIKVLTEGGQDILSRFRNEATVAGNLHHENIVTVYEYGEHEGQPFLVMEYLEGQDLHQVMAAHEPLTLLQKCNIMMKVAEGLYHAHRHGVVHRDVKPANIMLLRDGTVKLMDFGIARILRDTQATRLTQQGFVLGTLLYMAPEQLAGSEVDARCDSFAFGIIFYELLTGIHPFAAADARALMFKLSFEDPPPLAGLVPDCPEALDPVISRILHKDRELRYQSLKDVIFDIEPILIELRQSQAAQLLVKAQELYDKSELDAAQIAVSEVLSLDPSNRVARSLRETLQKQVQQRTLRPKIESLLKSAEQQLDARRFADAIQTLESALRLDRENAYIRSRIEQARSLWDSNKRISLLLTEAQRAYELQDFGTAQKAADEALFHEPQNSDAAALLKKITAAAERRAQKERIAKATGRVDELLGRQSYDEALEVLNGLGADADASEIVDLIKFVQAEKDGYERNRRMQEQTSVATGLLRQQRFEEAFHLLDDLQKEFPESSELSQFYSYAQRELAAQRRARAVQEAGANATALADAKNFSAAMGAINDALRQYPGEDTLVQAQQGIVAARVEWERHLAVEAIVLQAATLCSQGRAAEALQAVDACAREHNAAAELAGLRRDLERNIELQKRTEAIGEVCKEAQALLNRELPDAAVQLIERAQVQYPGESELSVALARAKDAVGARHRARAIAEIGRQAKALVEAKTFAGAHELLAGGLAEWPGDADLLRWQRDAQAGEEAWKKQQALQESMGQAKALAVRLQFVEALDLLEGTLSKYPQEPALSRLKRELEADWEKHEHQEALRQATERATALIAADRLQDAIQDLRESLKIYSGDPALRDLLKQCEDESRKRARAADVAKRLSEARSLAGVENFDPAIRIVEVGLANYTGEPALMQELELLRSAKAVWQRRIEIGNVVRQAADRSQQKRFSEAAQMVAKALAKYGNDPALQDARRQVEKALQEQQRREAVAKAAQEARAMIEGGQLDNALRLLTDACSRYPDEPELGGLLSRARQEIETRQRTEAIAQVRTKVRLSMAQNDYAAALEAVNRGIETWPQEDSLQAVREQIVSDQAAWEHNQAVAMARRIATELLSAGRIEQAVETIDQALSKYPDATVLTELKQQIARAREDKRRAEAVAAVHKQATLLIQQDRLEDAAVSLRDACQRYPGEAGLQSLLSQTQKEIEDRTKIAGAAAAAEALLKKNRIDEAIQTLEQALAAFPGNAILQSLLARGQRERAKRQRGEAVAETTAKCKALAAAGDFDAALAQLEEVLKIWPGESGLLELKTTLLADRAAWQRERALDRVIHSLQDLAREGRFAQGLEKADTALREFPESAVLRELHEHLRIQKALKDAAALIDGDRPAEALRLLEQLAGDGVTEAGLEPLIERAQQQIRIHQRRATIQALVAKAQRLSAERDFNGALALIDAGLRQEPEEASLLTVRAAIVSGQEQVRREEAIRNNLRLCETLELANRLTDALDLVEKTIAEYPGGGSAPDSSDVLLQQAFQRLRSKKADEESLRERLRDSEELGRLSRQAAQSPLPAEALALLGQARNIVERYPDDPAIRDAGFHLLQQTEAIARAQRELASRDFDGAVKTCADALRKFPGHVSLGRLHAEAESGQRNLFVEDLRRKVNAEADPDVRIRLLESALSRYPAERWVAEELRASKNQLDLIHLIVEKARAGEKAEQWDEALAQWNSLRNCYPSYPGLAAHIERVENKRAQLAAAAVARWCGQIEAEVDKDNLSGAAELLARALVENPGAPPLLALGQRLEQLQNRKARLRDLLARGQNEGAKGQYTQATATLREAFDLAAMVPESRKQVLAALVKLAQNALSSDWRMAEVIAVTATALVPATALPERLVVAIAGHKKDENVKEWVGQVERLRKAGDPLSALAEIDRSLAAHPEEQALTKLRKLLAPEAREFRDRADREIRQLREAALGTDDPAQFPALLAQAEAMTQRYRADEELRRNSEETVRRVSVRLRELEELRRAARSAALRKRIAVLAGGALVLVGAIFGLQRVFGPGNRVTVTVTTSPPGASVKVGEQVCGSPKCEFKLSPASYSFEARLDGYRPAVQSVTVDAAHHEPLRMVLNPLPPQVQVSTNLTSGTVSLDGKDAGSLTNGQRTLADVSFGKHQLKISSPDGQAQLDFETSAGSVPALLGKVVSHDSDTIVVSNMGREARVDCDCADQAVTLDGKPVGSIGSGQLALHDLTEGNKDLRLGEHPLVFSVRPEPSVSVFVTSRRNIGTLVIETNVDNPTILINNTKYAVPVSQGLIRIPLDVATYSVKVEKNGYKNSEAKTVQIQRGGTERLPFKLEPMNAAMQIRGAYPGTQVAIDGKPVGQVQNDQQLTTDAPTGQHAIDLSKPGYVSKRLTRNFEPGRTVTVESSDALLAPDENTIAETRRKEEQAAWDAVNKNDRAALDLFVEQHPNGKFVPDAKSQILKLEQDRKAEQQKQALQVEESAWNSVDRTKKSALQDFLNRYGNGPHSQAAREQIAELDKRDAEAQAAAQGLKEQTDKQQEAARRAADEQSVNKKISDYETAYNRKDLGALQGIWTGMPKDVARKTDAEFKDKDVKGIHFQLRPLAQPTVIGDSASVDCSRSLILTIPGQAIPPVKDVVRISLNRTAAGWVIRSIVAR